MTPLQEVGMTAVDRLLLNDTSKHDVRFWAERRHHTAHDIGMLRTAIRWHSFLFCCYESYALISTEECPNGGTI